jgi:hypothetical protein
MRAAVQSKRGGDVEPTSPRKECAMRFQKSQPTEPALTLTPEGNPMGPLEYRYTTPRRSARLRYARKSWHSCEHLRAITDPGRYEEEAPHKAGVGTNRPCMKR